MLALKIDRWVDPLAVAIFAIWVHLFIQQILSARYMPNPIPSTGDTVVNNTGGSPCLQVADSLVREAHIKQIIAYVII